MRFIVSILCCLSLITTLSHAEESPASQGKADDAKATRTCRILLLSPSEKIPKKLFLYDGAKNQEVELPSMNFSDIYPLPPGEITLRLTPRQPSQDEPIPAEAPGVTLPADLKDVYLLITADPKNTVTPVKIQSVNANPDGFRNGQMLWFNLTPFEVGGQVGSQKLALKPQSRLILDAPASGFTSYPTKIGYVPEAGTPAEMICSTIWQHDPQARTVNFVIMSPNGGTPRIRGFADSRPKPER